MFSTRYTKRPVVFSFSPSCFSVTSRPIAGWAWPARSRRLAPEASSCCPTSCRKTLPRSRREKVCPQHSQYRRVCRRFSSCCPIPAVEVLIAFYENRLKDNYVVTPPVLRGLLALVTVSGGEPSVRRSSWWRLFLLRPGVRRCLQARPCPCWGRCFRTFTSRWGSPADEGRPRSESRLNSGFSCLLQSLMLAERACVYNMLINLMDTREAGKTSVSMEELKVFCGVRNFIRRFRNSWGDSSGDDLTETPRLWEHARICV